MIHNFFNFLKEAATNAKTVNIVVKYEHPPIPDRQYDYAAYEQNEEDLDMIIGRGKTKEAAIQDFKNQYEAKNDQYVHFDYVLKEEKEETDNEKWWYDTTRETSKEFKPGDFVFFGYYGSLKDGPRGGKHIGKVVDINDVPEEYRKTLMDSNGYRYPKINWKLYVVVKDLTTPHRGITPYNIMSKDRIDLIDDVDNVKHLDEAAGPSKSQIAYHMKKAKQNALNMIAKYKDLNLNITPRLIRASNGEAAIIYDIIKDEKKETVTSLSAYERLLKDRLRNDASGLQQEIKEGENDPWPVVVQILDGKKHPVATFNQTKHGLKKAEKFLEDSRIKYPNTQFELVLKDMRKK